MSESFIDHLMWLTPHRSAGDHRLAQLALAAVERLFPGACFDHAGSLDTPRPLDRSAGEAIEEWVSLQDHKRLTLSLVSRYGARMALRFSDTLGIEGAEGRHPKIAFHVWLSAEAGTFAGREREVMRAIGDEVGAWRGTFDPGRAMDGIHGVQMEFRELTGITMTEAIGVELPVLYGHLDFEEPMRPDNLGWLNYWSAKVAEKLGFPDPSRDGLWLELAEASPTTGAWVVAITPDRFDARRPDHLRALSSAWARFSWIGLREPPPWPMRQP